MPNGTIYDNWIASGASRNPNDQYDIKIDYRINEKNLLSGKYSRSWNSSAFQLLRQFRRSCAGGKNKSGTHLFALNDTHTFSPTLLLTTIFGFTRGMENIDAYNGEGGVTDPLGKLGFPGYLNSNGFTGVPAIFINTYYSARTARVWAAILTATTGRGRIRDSSRWPWTRCSGRMISRSGLKAVSTR